MMNKRGEVSFWKKCACCWTVSETISVWSLKKCGVSKCLRLNGWNNIMFLKHPRSLSLKSICLCTHVQLLVCFQHSTYMFQPETSREVTRRIRNLHSQIPNTGFQRSCSGERWPPDEPRWGILEQYPSRQRLKGEDVGAEFLWSTPRKDPQCPERRAGKGLYLQRIAFQKDCLWLAVKLIYLLCPHMRKITHPPSEVCMHVYINVYLSSEFMCHNYHQARQRLLYFQLFPVSPQMFLSAFRFIGRRGSLPLLPTLGVSDGKRRAGLEEGWAVWVSHGE